MYKLLTLAMVGLAVLYGNFVHSKPLINGTWICDFELADMPDFEGQFSGSYFDDRGFDLVLDGQYDLNGHPIIANIHFMGEWWIENDRLMRQATDVEFIELTYRGMDVPDSIIPPTIFDEFLTMPVYTDIILLEDDLFLMEETQSKENCRRRL
jgi:hypothetical protein